MKYSAYQPSKASQIQHDIRISLTSILCAINDLRKNIPLTAQKVEIACTYALKKGVIDD